MKTEILKKGNRKLGEIVKLDDGRSAMFVYRNHSDLYRGSHKTLSGAMREEEVCWAIETELLMRARTKVVQFVGVKMKDTGDVYLTTLERFTTLGKVVQISKSGPPFKILPLNQFSRKIAPIKLSNRKL